MARIVSTKITPIITANVQTIMNDGSISNMEFKKDDVLTDFRYVKDEEIVKVSGRVSSIAYTILPTVRTYTELAKLRSNFASDVVMNSVDIDASEKYNSNVITIPAREIIEKEDVNNVTRIKYSLKFAADFEIKLTDGTTNKFTLHEGDDVTGLVYLSDGKEATIDARLVAMKYNSSLVPTDLVLVADGKIKVIEVLRVKAVGGTTVPVSAGTNIADAIKSSTTGTVAVSQGTFTDVITADKDVVIRGAKAGIPATNRAARKADEETVFAGSVKATNGANITFDGVTLTQAALIDSAGAANVTIKNCVVADIAPTATKSYLIKNTAADNGNINISGCYFGKNQSIEGKNIYNLFELNGPLKDGTVIENNYFEEGCSIHNDINIYQVEEGATITIRNNTWERSMNGIRIGIKGEPKCTINIEGNRYMATDPDPDYAGLLIIQPYGKQTTSMANTTININNTTFDGAVTGEPFQLYYMYAGSADMQFTKSNVPTISVDGKVEVQPVSADTTEDTKDTESTTETKSSTEASATTKV